MARPKKAESIRRTSNVMVRFSSIEYELVAGYAKDSGYPISTFVRKQALSEKVTVNYNIVADIGEIQNLTAQAAGIGNNLNQIARYFHGGGLASRGMLEELKKCIVDISGSTTRIVSLTTAVVIADIDSHECPCVCIVLFCNALDTPFYLFRCKSHLQ